MGVGSKGFDEGYNAGEFMSKSATTKFAGPACKIKPLPVES